MRAARILFRRILSQRWGAVAIVASLAIGIGLNGAMYAFLVATFIRPFAFDQRHRLVEICQQERGSPTGNCLNSRPDLEDLREASQSYAAITAYNLYGTSLSLGDGQDEEEVEVAEADINFAAVTGIRPRYGRMFGPEDFAQGAPPVGILSDAFWRKSFLGDPRMVGSLIHLGRKDVRVVGIMPPEFAFPFNSAVFGAQGTGVWMPRVRNANEKRTSRNVSAAALLKEGVTARQAQEEASVIAARLANLHAEDKEYTFEVHGLDYDLRAHFGKTAEITGIITALILILAVLNVSGILLTEYLRRREEWRLRVMLGATRWQLLRPFLAHSLALSLSGGMVGAWLAALFPRTAYRFLPSQLPHPGDAVVNWSVLGFVVVVSAVAGVVSGMWPVLVANLRAGGGGHARYGENRETARRTTAKARRVLVMAQVAGAMALLSLTGMLLAHVHAVANTNVGFRADHLVSFLWTSSKPSWSGVELLRKNLESIPGVEAVAFTHNPPLTGEFDQKFLLSGDGPAREGTESSAYFNSVSSDYFRVLGIPLRAGRFFSEEEEQPGGSPTVVVNEAFVRHFSPMLPILGRRLCVREGDGKACDWREIIGVAGDVRDSGIFDPPDPAFYLPWRQNTRPTGAHVCLRTRIAPEIVLGSVRKAVSQTSPGDHAFFIETVENLARKQISAGIVILYGAAVAAAATILLAAGGLYGTLSNVVNQSRRETGIRMAIGATRSATIWHFTGDAGKWVALGLALGVVGAIAMNESAQAAVYGLPSLKLWVVAAAGTVVMVVSFLAVLLPVREAAYLDPAEVLRHE
jgi:predicted permease